MLTWSQYNLLFDSKKWGFFVYNSLSNTLTELTKTRFFQLRALKENANGTFPWMTDDVKKLLLQNRILGTELDEKEMLNNRKKERDAHWNGKTCLHLAIAPTLACNFRCTYCYEQDVSGKVSMRERTERRLIRFLQSFKDISDIDVVWLGGEPLLAFDGIRRLTKQMLDIQIPYRAHLVTNGYLLDRSVVEQLSDLCIASVQVTIDGPAHIHDGRRIHRSGGATFSRIMKNLAYLLANWDGRCAVRVNVDKSNQEAFPEFYAFLNHKFPGTGVYPAMLHDFPGESSSGFCLCGRMETADFHLFLLKNRIPLKGGVFPSTHDFGHCVANHLNGFVVGPDGRLFKCWVDLGIDSKSIGQLENSTIEDLHNNALFRKYQYGVDPYDDEECLRCFYFPICNGGCFHHRVNNRYFGEKRDVCTKYKGRMTAFLEAYFDMKMNRNIYEILAGSGQPENNCNGFTLI